MPMLKALRDCGRGLLAALVGSLLLLLSASADAPARVHRILVLYGESNEVPAMSAVERCLMGALRSRSPDHLEIYPEYLDHARFAATRSWSKQFDWFGQKYAGRKIDLIVSVTSQPMEYLLHGENTPFSGVPIVYCGVDTAETA